MLITQRVVLGFSLSWCQQGGPEPLWTLLDTENWSVGAELKESILLQLMILCSLDTVWRSHTLCVIQVGTSTDGLSMSDSPASRQQFVTLPQTEVELWVFKDRSLNIYLRIWNFIFGSLIFSFFFFFFPLFTHSGVFSLIPQLLSGCVKNKITTRGGIFQSTPHRPDSILFEVSRSFITNFSGSS